jgi:radical SAM family RiPP maturation amino acid epimerase
MTNKQPDLYYWKVFEPFSAAEIALIVQLKRFFEWVDGDPDFLRNVEANAVTSEQCERLRRIGITFDLNAIAMFWESPNAFRQYFENLQRGGQHELPGEILAQVKQYPLVDLWVRFVAQKNALYRKLRQRLFRIPRNPQFDAWRMRRIAAVQSELGFFGHVIDHPILAFELGDGCSVGCWFCAFAARKLTQNFDYADNREFFRHIAQTCVDLFGADVASLALLYYGTEPHDNPHYLDFVKDYTAITGSPVCTSTAVPTDEQWLRELIAFYRQGPHPWPRLSVLSKAMLFKIHDLYSPEELRDVELLMQMKYYRRQKVTGGRILKEETGLRNREHGHYLDGIVPQGSIACVSGFLINLVNRTIQVVSPCYTSQKWSYGYRVFDEAHFEDVDAFRRVMAQLIERNMPDAPFSTRLVRFRDDLVYRQTDAGFDLVSPNQVHHFCEQEIYGPLGRLIAEGKLTYNDLFDAIVDQYRINPMLSVVVVKRLFDGGFLDEVNPTCASGTASGETAAR